MTATTIYDVPLIYPAPPVYTPPTQPQVVIPISVAPTGMTSTFLQPMPEVGQQYLLDSYFWDDTLLDFPFQPLEPNAQMTCFPMTDGVFQAGGQF